MGADAITGPVEEAVLGLLHTSDLLLKYGKNELFDGAITQAHFNILMILNHEPDGICQRDLARRIVVTQGNVSQQVVALENSGLLRRAVDPNDQRYRVLSLTAKGRQVVRRMEPRYRRVIRSVFRNVSDHELKTLTRVLGKIREDIQP